MTDPDHTRTEEARQRYNAKVVAPAEIHRAEADIFAPCAIGGTLNPEAIAERSGIVAGAANDQLGEPDDGRLLHDRGILCCPDFVANAGGVLAVAPIGEQYDRGAALLRVDLIGDTMELVREEAEKKGISTSEAADQLVQRRLFNAKKKAAALLSPP